MENRLLTKESASEQIRTYFEGILKLYQNGEEFPINLDDVWGLAYSRKDKAVNALRRGEFYEGTDFQASQNRKVVSINNLANGVPTEVRLSVKGLEFLIARKNRDVFEVYRTVFQKVATGEVKMVQNTTMTLPDFSNPAEAARAWANEYEQKMIATKRADEAEKQVATLTTEVQKKDAVITKQQPKVDHFDMFMNGFGDNKDVSVRCFVNQARIDGEEHFWKWMYEKKIVYRNATGKPTPYADYADIFVLRDVVCNSNGWSGQQMKVRGDKKVKLAQMYYKEHPERFFEPIIKNDKQLSLWQ